MYHFTTLSVGIITNYLGQVQGWPSRAHVQQKLLNDLPPTAVCSDNLYFTSIFRRQTPIQCVCHKGNPSTRLGLIFPIVHNYFYFTFLVAGGMGHLWELRWKINTIWTPSASKKIYQMCQIL